MPGPRRAGRRAGLSNVGRAVGSVVLFTATVWIAGTWSLLGLLGGCGVSPEGDGDGVSVASALCDSERLTSEVAAWAVFVIPGLLLLAAQVAYWKRHWPATTLLTVATLIPGFLMLVLPSIVG